MSTPSNWNWESGERLIADLNEWNAPYQWVEEPYISPDGEKTAAIVNLDEAEFGICENGKLWCDDVYDKAWSLKYTQDGRLTAIVSVDDEWTVAVDGVSWGNTYDYVWNKVFSESGDTIAVAVQQDGEYSMVINDNPWDNTFDFMTSMTLSPDGKNTSAVVQTVEFGSGEIFKFKEGCFTAAPNGNAWNENFVNVWKMAFNAKGDQLAAEVRLNLYDYTIAVNGKPWEQTFGCVWKPVFNPSNGSVMAAVKKAGKWTIAEDGQIIWDTSFAQTWRQTFSPDGKKVAAVVAPSYGKWTIAVDGKAWKYIFNESITDLTFSPDSRRISAIGKNNGRYRIISDGNVWEKEFDMVWAPVFNADSSHLAAKVEVNGKRTIAVDGKIWSHMCDDIQDPVFSPDGSKILCKCIENGKYFRRIVKISDILS